MSTHDVYNQQPTQLPRIALLSDTREWAFHQNALGLEKSIKHRFACEHHFVEDWQKRVCPPPRLDSYDVVFCPYHRWGIGGLIPWRKTIGSLRAQWMIPERKLAPRLVEFDMVNKFGAFYVVTRANYAEYREHCPRLYLLTNPVDTERFQASNLVPFGQVVASWNGNAQHATVADRDVKGFYSIVIPACKAAGVPLAFAEYHTKRLSFDEMPEFYRYANVALCTSLYEGASSSLLEAMASGQAAISTDVGNAKDMHETMLRNHGRSGIMIVERSVEAFVEALRYLKANQDKVAEMGALNRIEIEKEWSWHRWTPDFLKLLSIPLK